MRSLRFVTIALGWVGRVLRRALIIAVPLAGLGISIVWAQSLPPNIPPQYQALFNQLPPDEQQKLLQQYGGQLNQLGQLGQPGQPQAIPPSVSPQQTVLTPSEPDKKVSGQTSRLETIMSQRAGKSLRLFGYDQLGAAQTVTSSLVGAIGDNYILGPGDQLDVTLRGQEDGEFTITVDRDGRVILPKLPPIAAAGRTLGDVRRDLIAAVHHAYISTDGYVTVSGVRQINVLVVGEVGNPGQQTLTGLSTVLDALALAGGVKKSGSLRDVTIIRGNQALRVDLYSILMSHGRTPDLGIMQGDRVVVPAIGSTVAVVGDVRRQGIYELPKGSSAITIGELVKLGNGPELRGVYRETVLRIRPDGKEQFSDVTAMPSALVRDGEILFVSKAVDFSVGKVRLSGSVQLPGQYSLDKAKTLHDLLPTIEVFKPTPYMLMGIIIRIDPQTLQRTVIPFSPMHVLLGRENMPLISDDEVRILTVAEMQQLVSDQINSDQDSPWAEGDNSGGDNGNQFISVPGAPSNSMVTQPGTGPQTSPGGAAAPGSASQTVPAGMGQPGSISQSATSNSTVADTGTVAEGNTTAAGNAGEAAETAGVVAGGAEGADVSLGELSADDASFFGHVLADYGVKVTGAIRDQGIYLVSPGTSLDEVIAAANGLDADADVGSFEITSTQIDNVSGQATTHRQIYHVDPSGYRKVILNPLDVIEFHHVFKDTKRGEASIAGEVRYPGSFSLLRGEHLSQVLARAGGLTDVAYPYGTVFLRRSVASIERAGFQRIADEVQRQMLVGLTKSGSSSSQSAGASPETLGATQAFIAELRNQKALGRISIIADPSVLAAHPERDPILEPGDSIFIPQRPSTVTVLGDVMQPGSYPFDPAHGAEDYIDLAGGYGEDPEKDLAYIVYPDGTAQRMERSWLRFNSQGIPPGSVIFVPQDLFPPNWLTMTISIGDIVKDLAVSVASVAVLSKAN